MKNVLRALTVLVVTALVVFALRTWIVSPVRIAGVSMENTLSGGDVALVSRWEPLLGITPGFGDIVECRFPGRDGTYVKRVIGTPGDTVEISDGVLFLNGRPISEPYVSSAAKDFSAVLGEDEYLVLGDNRAESYDSREADVGLIGSGDFLGRVRWILWPMNRFGPIKE